MTEKLIKVKVKITYDGKGPSCAARVEDAETGEQIEGAYRVVIDANDNNMPIATIYAYFPVIDVTTNAHIIYVCANCRQELQERELSSEQFMQEYQADFIE